MKRQRRLTGLDGIMSSLTTKGLTTGELSAHFQDICGATQPEDTIPVSPTKSSMRVLSGRTCRSSVCTRRYSTTLCTSHGRNGQVANQQQYEVGAEGFEPPTAGV